jgi:hypothetical protein
MGLGFGLLSFSLWLPLCLGLGAFAHDSPPFSMVLPPSGWAHLGPAGHSYLSSRRIIKAIPAVFKEFQ